MQVLLLPKAKMAGSASAPNQPCHIRSSSMPSRAHPVVLRVEEELHKLKTSVATSSSTPQMMSDRLRELTSVYQSMKELLCLPCNGQAFTCSLQKKWLEDELDQSIRLLDLSGNLQDSLAKMEEHIEDLQVALRRRDDAAVERQVKAYLRFAKRADKDVKNCFRSLKQDEKCVDKDSDIPVVGRFLTELKVITLTLLHPMSSFLSIQMPRPKTSRWSFVSKALSKRKVACEGEHEDRNRIDRSDFFSWNASFEYISCKNVDDGKVVKLPNQLQIIEDNAKVLENGLECLFKQLIQSRVLLLNILSS